MTAMHRLSISALIVPLLLILSHFARADALTDQLTQVAADQLEVPSAGYCGRRSHGLRRLRLADCRAGIQLDGEYRLVSDPLCRSPDGAGRLHRRGLTAAGSGDGRLC
jgi:hypothetical protein